MDCKSFIPAHETASCFIFSPVCYHIQVNLIGTLTAESKSMYSEASFERHPLERALYFTESFCIIILLVLIKVFLNLCQRFDKESMPITVCDGIFNLSIKGQTFFICWITLHELKFFRSAIRKKIQIKITRARLIVIFSCIDKLEKSLTVET